jgi:hypothetical protein
VHCGNQQQGSHDRSGWVQCCRHERNLESLASLGRHISHIPRLQNKETMRATCGEVPLENLVRFMQKCSEVPAKQKEQVFLHFLEKSVPRPSPDIFQIFRLLLPAVSASWATDQRCMQYCCAVLLLSTSAVAGCFTAGVFWPQQCTTQHKERKAMYHNTAPAVCLHAATSLHQGCIATVWPWKAAP